MNFIGPKVSDTFLEFIDEGFRKFNNKPHALSDVVNLMKNLSKYFEACYEIMVSTTSNLDKICQEHNIELIPRDALNVENFFEGITLIIICPIVGKTIFVRVINKETYIEVFENLLGGAAINNLLSDEEREGPFNGIYTKDVLFVRTSGAPKGSAMLAYRESRFHIYNKALIDLDYDDVALDPKIGYSYLSSVFESLYKEIFNNLNHFYFV